MVARSALEIVSISVCFMRFKRGRDVGTRRARIGVIVHVNPHVYSFIHPQSCRQARLRSSCNQSVKSLVRHRKPCAFSGIVHGMYTVYIRSVYTMHILYLYLLCISLHGFDAWFCFGFAWSFLGRFFYVALSFLVCCLVLLGCSLAPREGPTVRRYG